MEQAGLKTSYPDLAPNNEKATPLKLPICAGNIRMTYFLISELGADPPREED